MADKQAEIQALQAIVTGLSSQSFSHRIQGLVFGSKGLAALADKYAEHAEEEMTWVEKFANRILDLGGDIKIEATPEVKVYDDIVEYLKNEKKVSEEGIAQVSEMMPVFASDFVAYEDVKAYLIDEDADLQETNQDLELIELIGVQNWLVQKLNGTAASTTAE
ncbi:bacterioferritin [Slackia heliotrinireducens]|uniref:Bacterioferritin (Cytochrome b1) n=1 Tax=Slackia heliotrinireducens (strain ATCC 29202 / DSM 20476 / NCTC 11029 / RHS 1) TaxID=471855 RepID=C7N2E0_SLAHD|nr:ferritin-like domain-containing protein [Slackia heliotrinireducens]ACV21446.1 bacterioferritin (cytochrome b1) [Slackia heliotrinireducens DSM 20476]VEG98885.1 bacterioferritin [Slackia heliotrinireducens]